MNSGIAQISDLASIFKSLVSAILGFAGIVLFILLLTGGFKYITSGGDPKAVDSAQKTLTYAIGGLLVILLAYVFLVFISKVTGVDVTKFSVTLPK